MTPPLGHLAEPIPGLEPGLGGKAVSQALLLGPCDSPKDWALLCRGPPLMQAEGKGRVPLLEAPPQVREAGRRDHTCLQITSVCQVAGHPDTKGEALSVLCNLPSDSCVCVPSQTQV